MYKSIVREKLIQYLEATKMSKYRFSQKSGMSQSTLYDILRKEDYDIRESNIVKVNAGDWTDPRIKIASGGISGDIVWVFAEFKNDCRKEDLKSMFHLVHKILYMKKFDWQNRNFFII